MTSPYRTIDIRDEVSARKPVSKTTYITTCIGIAAAVCLR